MLSAIANGGDLVVPQVLLDAKPETPSRMPMPAPVRDWLVRGMHQVTNGERGTARPSIMRTPYHNPEALQLYKQWRPRIIGKTGTAEILYKGTIDAQSPAQLEKHVWFGGVGFSDHHLQDPELVVVVYSRFGSAGRQGAPIAAKLMEKWREIQQAH